MIVKVLSVVCLALCVLGDGPAISEQKVIMYNKEHSGHHGELSHIGEHKPEHHEEYAWAYPSYEFSYHVDDPHTHDNKGQHETRHGDEVKGEYWLIEPDGRKRTVKYHADKHSGFNADVEYSAPHHHVYFKTHKHEDHKPVVDHHHEEPKIHHEHKPVVHHHHVEHKVIEHHHDDHKPVVEHHHEPHHVPHHEINHEPHHVPHHEFHHEINHEFHHEPLHVPHHEPWVISKYHGHHDRHHGHHGHHDVHSRPFLRRLQENFHHGHHSRYYRTPKE